MGEGDFFRLKAAELWHIKLMNSLGRPFLKKESALYRFVYTVALLAGAAVVSGTGLLGLFYALADLALADHAMPSELVVSGVYLALFLALALASLAFTALFNLRPLMERRRTKRPGVKKALPWYGWAFVSAAACALFALLRFGLPFFDFLDASQLRMGVVFFFLPFLWEYALGLGRLPAPAGPKHGVIRADHQVAYKY
jgi:hypothetical protein